VNDQRYSFLDVCRGRYLCEKHGGFCDGADNYCPKCPVCDRHIDRSDEAVWTVNRVDRVLHQVNGLQKRSLRNASLVSTILAGIGAITVLAKLVGLGESANVGFAIVAVEPIFLQSGLAILVLTIGFYAVSMMQLRVVKDGEFTAKPMSVWETELSKRFAAMERWHAGAGISFGFAVLLIFLSLASPAIQNLSGVLSASVATTLEGN
jgi:hypothetical protein